MSALIQAEASAASCPGRPAAPISVLSVCRALEFSRATFYRLRLQPEPLDPDVALRGRIQELALEWPPYGYRRICAALQREGAEVNRKRVLRIMREDNLLCLRRQRFKIATTDSAHGLAVYPNLAKDMIVAAPDRLWVADITYVRLNSEFVYVAVVLDAFSRRVVGWRIARRIDARLAEGALSMAIQARKPAPGLVHHSDRGVQYASRDYIDMLNAGGIAVSMSRKGTPQDNAFAESFMKTLKYEEVYMTEYRNLADAQESIGNFIEQVYNAKRLHSAIGYMPPEEFEQSIRNQANSRKVATP